MKIMLTNFLLKRQIADLIHRSRHERNISDQYSCILELGRLPPTDESINCLILHTVEDRGLKPGAILALGMLDDFRARNHLLRLLRGDGMGPDSEMEKAFSQPHHVNALTELAGIAHDNCRLGADNWLASRLVDLMQRIDPVASQPHIEGLAQFALDGALRQLRQGNPTDAPPGWAEMILAQCRQPSGLAAMRVLQNELGQRHENLVPHHREIIMTSGDFREIESSLEWLRKSTRPAAAEAVKEFLRSPSRQVTNMVSRVISDDDDPAVKTVWEEVSCDTSELGQPRSLEELAEREATGTGATDQTREAYQAMKAERERREKVYPDLLTLGTQRDLEDYARTCLTDPAYDGFSVPAAESHEPARAKLNYLARFLQQAPGNARAAELLRLILAGDRTRLWAATREAFALHQVSHAWPTGIDWKPLALEMLEPTDDPALDGFLVSQIENDNGIAEPGLLWPVLQRRNPGQLLELAARLLLRTSARKIPVKDPAWQNEPARMLLTRTLPPGGRYGDLALAAVFASKPTALRIAREMQGRKRRRDRMPAYFLMCLLGGPEVETELTAWLAAENDPLLLETLARHRSAAHVPPAQPAPPPPEAAAAVPPRPPSAPAAAASRETQPIMPVVVPQKSPSALRIRLRPGMAVILLCLIGFAAVSLFLQGKSETLLSQRVRAFWGSTEAQFQLGWRYREGRGVALDFSQAAVWFEKTARAGSARGQHDLGTLYYYGLGVPEDSAAARVWFERAASQDYPPAMSMLGLIVANDDEDPDKALELWRRAAALKYVWAEYLLGLAYLKQHSASRDHQTSEIKITRALYWLEKARRDGVEPVGGLLQQVWMLVPDESVERVKQEVFRGLQEGIAP